MDNSFTASEAAEVLGLDTHTVAEYCRTGRLKGADKRAGRWFVPRAEVRRFGKEPRPVGNPDFSA